MAELAVAHEAKHASIPVQATLEIITGSVSTKVPFHLRSRSEAPSRHTFHQSDRLDSNLPLLATWLSFPRARRRLSVLRKLHGVETNPEGVTSGLFTPQLYLLPTL